MTSNEDRQAHNQGQNVLNVDIKPVEEDSKEGRYSNRSKRDGRDSPIQYDMPNTDTERIALKTENDRLLNAIYDLKTNLANKDEEIDDLQQTIQEINIKFAETESARVELRAAIEELAESSGKGEDREKRAWDRLARVLGWTEAKSKDIKERLAKAIYKKKGFF